MVTFVDAVTLYATAGDGGNGCASIHREKFKPLGGPDGGNGGRGGDVVLVADPQVRSLLEYHHSPHRRATNGQPGQGGNRNGGAGRDVVLAVPVGTVVCDPGGLPLADLNVPGSSLVLAAGGRGGLGNAALASRRRKAPGFALLGEPGEVVTAVLELKTMADVGLIGFPSAGKSSLVAALSAARPKIADYPFTTLAPNLGVVTAGETVFTVADVPGLIPGAAQGRGLGLDFLRHIERCAALVHVIDCATLEAGRDPITDFEVIEAELAQYGGLTDRPRIVALNKVDVPEARELAELVEPELRARGMAVVAVSAVSHAGLRELAFQMAAVVRQARADAPTPTAERLVIRPRAVDDPGFEVVAEGVAFRVLGQRPTRWVSQTDFSNDEAVGYLADRLARLGVDEALAEAGALPGAEVRIGDADNSVVFDWEPNVAAALPGPRGQDSRIDAPATRVHGPSRARLDPFEEPEASWDDDPVDEPPRTLRPARTKGLT